MTHAPMALFAQPYPLLTFTFFISSSTCHHSAHRHSRLAAMVDTNVAWERAIAPIPGCGPTVEAAPSDSRWGVRAAAPPCHPPPRCELQPWRAAPGRGHGRQQAGAHPRSLLRRRRARAARIIFSVCYSGGCLRAARRSSTRLRGARGPAGGDGQLEAADLDLQLREEKGRGWPPSPFLALRAAAALRRGGPQIRRWQSERRRPGLL
jgi:hypothetical protein